MDLLTTLRIIARQWYVVASGLVLTAVAAFAVFQSVDPTYEARGTALVVSPQPPDAETVTSQNPFTRFDSSTSAFAGVATMLMDDIQVREALGNQGILPNYQIFQLNQSVPLLTVVVQDKDEERTLESTAAVLAAINDELDRRQAAAGAPEDSRIRSIVVTEPNRAVRLVTDSLRAALLTVVVGVAASISLAFIAEGYTKNRARRREVVTPAFAVDPPRDAGDIADTAEAAETADTAKPDDAHDSNNGNGNGRGRHEKRGAPRGTLSPSPSDEG
jgi:hypothetical protein